MSQKNTVPNLIAHHGAVHHYPGFFSVADSDRLSAALLREVSWKHEHIKLFGKSILQPRLTASFSDPGVAYGYSGIVLKSDPWNKALFEIKERVVKHTGLSFNTALLNLYRDGKDYMGWHRDNEAHLGTDPPVASVSFGAKRRFQVRAHATKSNTINIELGHGDLLLMLGEVQKYWEHRLPRALRVEEPRINITFRNVVK